LSGRRGEKGRFYPGRDDVVLVVVDMQDSVLAAMEDGVARLVKDNMGVLIDSFRFMNIPLLITEQYPQGLGRTVATLREKIAEFYLPVEKTTFSCYRQTHFQEKLQKEGSRHVVLAGVETHICVLQTALDLLDAGYEVSVVGDATCSRYKFDWRVGLREIERAGGVVTSTEAIIFCLLKEAGTAEFKAISPLIQGR